MNRRSGIYILADLEGSAWVTRPVQTALDRPGYGPAAATLVEDVNAVAGVLLDAGSEPVLFHYYHGIGSNWEIDFARLDPRLTVVKGPGSPYPCLPGHDLPAGASILLGMHACAGEESHDIGHTFDGSALSRLSVNGETVGEPSVLAWLLSALGMPVILLAGEDGACREIRRRHPGLAAVASKTGLGPRTAVSPPRRAYLEELRAGARAALAAGPRPAEQPARFEVAAEMRSLSGAMMIEAHPGGVFERRGLEIRFACAEPGGLLRWLYILFALHRQGALFAE